MTLLPVLPALEDESLTSYLSRVSAFHFRRGVRDVLSDIELSQQSVLVPDEASLARMSRLTGTSVDHLKTMTFLREGSRMRSFRGETVHAEFGNLNNTSFCPACLLEDRKTDSASGGLRVGRSIWQLEPVRDCQKHGILLHRRRNTSHAEKFQLMDEVGPSDKELERMVNEADCRLPSDLSKWVLSRLSGQNGPEWLDSQPVDLAARACEMLGVILTAGTHVNLKTLPAAAWCEAGHIGFSYASRGEEGIREALQEAFDRFEAKGLRGGPQKVLGRLYQWLQFSENYKDTGPIRDVVRDFILDQFPISEGTDLFGQPVDRQRVHTAYSLSEKTGAHYKTIFRAAVLTGLVDGDPSRPSSTKVFDAVKGEALVERIRTSITQRELTAYLNCNRVQGEQLVRTGIIPRLIPDEENVNGVLKQVAREDADAFLSNFMGAATRVDRPSKGVMDVLSAAEISRWPVVDIVNGILGGLFGTVELADPSLKFKGVLVDPVEVREVLAREKAEGRVTLREAARIVGMPTHGISWVSKIRKPCGAPYFAEHFVSNAKGTQTRLFAVEDLQWFLDHHISLSELAETERFSVKVMKLKMDGRGAVPIAPKYELGRIWYRRGD